jgi:hypothetical protein
MRKAGFATLLGLGASLIMTSSSFAVVIGNWEGGSSDQWIDWSSQSSYAGGVTNLPSPEYQFSSTGATLGSSSLELTKSGFSQTLSIKLEYVPGGMAAFFANNALQIDVTLPATTSSGYSQFYDVALNAPVWGFTSLSATHPLTQASWGWGSTGGPQQTHTITIPYGQALASIPANASYAEFIIATNNDGVHNQYFFDNAQLITIPEPATLGLGGIAAVGLLLRRRRSNQQ